MYQVRIFNPIALQMEPVSPEHKSESESEAMAMAEKFFFENGVKIGDICPEDSERPIAVFGYRDEDSIATGIGGYYAITNSVYFVFRYIKETLGIKVDSFIDLGCGVGNILLCAANVLAARRLAGVELDPGLVSRAKELTRHLNADIIEGDIRTWRPEINDYDMVYMYAPFSEDEPQQVFMEHLKTWLRDGQYVYYQRVIGAVPEWLTEIGLPNHPKPCLFKFDKSKL